MFVEAELIFVIVFLGQVAQSARDVARQTLYCVLSGFFESCPCTGCGDKLHQVKTRVFLRFAAWKVSFERSWALLRMQRRAVREKQMPFMAGEGDCPFVPSRAPVQGVHWSEAKAP